MNFKCRPNQSLLFYFRVRRSKCSLPSFTFFLTFLGQLGRDTEISSTITSLRAKDSLFFSRADRHFRIWSDRRFTKVKSFGELYRLEEILPNTLMRVLFQCNVCWTQYHRRNSVRRLHQRPYAATYDGKKSEFHHENHRRHFRCALCGSCIRNRKIGHSHGHGLQPLFQSECSTVHGVHSRLVPSILKYDSK